MPSGSRKSPEIKPFYGRRSTSFAQAHCIKDSVWLDPAAGFGNFLTEAYLSLRRLENDILRETITDSSGTGILGFDEDEFNPI